MSIEIIKSKLGHFDVVIDSVNYGVFDQLENNGLYSYFQRRQDELTGDHYIEIGEALNCLNKSVTND